MPPVMNFLPMLIPELRVIETDVKLIKLSPSSQLFSASTKHPLEQEPRNSHFMLQKRQFHLHYISFALHSFKTIFQNPWKTPLINDAARN